jgi:hypothetical protein
MRRHNRIFLVVQAFFGTGRDTEYPAKDIPVNHFFSYSIVILVVESLGHQLVISFK